MTCGCAIRLLSIVIASTSYIPQSSFLPSSRLSLSFHCPFKNIPSPQSALYYLSLMLSYSTILDIIYLVWRAE
ncbi:hypothetical protein BT96DRAFT_512445 [Gymnopus androsaceus JB14]|uniref:Uncharacterized protein n=1 Tax=Gymnopus androsaceus JB14 TaxID=1447944 RepID=A0A6A4I2P7_9AGAR|nr:hypothetical protein BT96DRAFT_512445 [Gymnopus androsaceus JB14]